VAAAATPVTLSNTIEGSALARLRFQRIVEKFTPTEGGKYIKVLNDNQAHRFYILILFLCRSILFKLKTQIFYYCHFDASDRNQIIYIYEDEIKGLTLWIPLR
jgi:hypothetical protein